MKALSTEKISQIQQLLRDGLSHSQTASRCGVSKGTVSKYRGKHLQELGKSKGGRPAILSAQTKSLIV
jgi:DNA-binding NarL/FixJ family response regulator